MLTRSLLAAFGLALSLQLPAFAEVRIVTVDMARVLNESPEAAAKKKELDAVTKSAKAKAEAKREELEERRAQLQAAKVKDDSKEAEKLIAEAKEYQRFVRDTEDDIKKRYMRVNRDVTQKAMARIQAFAKANKIDLVLDKSDKYRGPVLFRDEAVDITEEIIDAD